MTEEQKALYARSRQSARSLYKSSGGIMFLFLGILALLRSYIFYPIGRLFWSLALMMIPDHYISNQNILGILKAPLVPVIGLALVVGYGLLVLWETSGLLLILEYHYQGKTIRLWKLFILSARQILHAAKPKNWLILLYALVMMPLTDIFSVSNMVGSLTIPEYIAEFIGTTWWVYIPYVAVSILAIWLVLHWIFAYEGFILERLDFSPACKASRRLIKGRLIRTFRKVGFYELITALLCSVPPALITGALYAASFYLDSLSEQPAGGVVRDMVIMQYGSVLLFNICGIVVKMKMLSYLFALYHIYREDCGIDDPIELPEWGLKLKGHIFRLRFMSGAVYTAAAVMILAAFSLLSYSIRQFPEVAEFFIDETNVVAHKGYSEKAPENTMSAFEAAIDCGAADMIEFDVRLTRDGVPVVIHDASILKACGVDEDVYDLTLSELQAYTANYHFTDGTFDEVIPTLEEVLKSCSGRIGLLVEIKASDRSPDLPAQIVRLLEKYDCLDNAVIQSGSYEALCQVKEVCPQIPCGLIMAIGIGNYYDMPNVDFFSVEHTFVSQSIVEAIHDRGKEIYVWTVNEDTSLEKMRNMGADAIITDKPEYVSQTLKANNLNFQALVENAVPTIGSGMDVSDGD